MPKDRLLRVIGIYNNNNNNNNKKKKNNNKKNNNCNYKRETKESLYKPANIFKLKKKRPKYLFISQREKKLRRVITSQKKNLFISMTNEIRNINFDAKINKKINEIEEDELTKG